jgi:hypothetical protein
MLPLSPTPLAVMENVACHGPVGLRLDDLVIGAIDFDYFVGATGVVPADGAKPVHLGRRSHRCGDGKGCGNLDTHPCENPAKRTHRQFLASKDPQAGDVRSLVLARPGAPEIDLLVRT